MTKRAFFLRREGVAGAIFMIGLAILFIFDWIWPGILVLIGVTSLIRVYIRQDEPNDSEIPLSVEAHSDEADKVVHYTSQCASCGAETPLERREGRSSQPAPDCGFCGSKLTPAQ